MASDSRRGRSQPAARDARALARPPSQTRLKTSLAADYLPGVDRDMRTTMNDRLPVVDADGHVTEPFTVWTDYVEPAFRSRAPRVVFDERGRPCGLIDERIVMRHAMLLTLGPEYRFDPEKIRAGGGDPRARLTDMDAEGGDVAVL